MKPLIKISKSERQANQLWSGFRRANQEGFWVSYEQLVQRVQILMPPTQPTLVKDNTHSNRLKPVIPTTYYSRKLNICVGFIILFGLSIVSTIAIQGLESSQFLIIMLFFGIVSVGVYATFFVLSFSVSPEGFKVDNSWKNKAFFHWEELGQIKITHFDDQKELQIITLDNRHLSFDYSLTKKNHRQLFKTLRQRITDVYDSKYYN